LELNFDSPCTSLNLFTLLSYFFVFVGLLGEQQKKGNLQLVGEFSTQKAMATLAKEKF